MKLKPKCIGTLQSHTNTVASLVCTLDGQYLCSGSWDKTIKIWRLADGQCVATLQGHTDHVSCLVCTLDRQYLCSGSWDNTIKIWRLDSQISLYKKDSMLLCCFGRRKLHVMTLLLCCVKLHLPIEVINCLLTRIFALVKIK